MTSLTTLAVALAPIVIAAENNLDGRWMAPGLSIEIEQGIETGRIDAGPSERFRLEDLQGKSVIFDIGAKRFFGLLAGDVLAVTTLENPAAKTLRRSFLRPSIKD